MNSGKYQKQLSKVMITLGFLFILILTVSITLWIKTTSKNQYRDTLKQSAAANNMVTEVTLSVVYSAMNTLINDHDIMLWSDATDHSQYYYYAYIARRKMEQLSSQFSMIPFYPAVTHLESDSLVISSLGTNQKEAYFQEETTLTEDQICEIFAYYQENSGELIVPSYTDGELTDVYYFVRAAYRWRDLLYIIRIPKSSLIGTNSNLNFILYNSDRILAYSLPTEGELLYWDSVYPSLQPQANLKDEQLTEQNQHFVFSSGFSYSSWKLAYSYEDNILSYRQILFYILLPFIIFSILSYLLFRKLSSWLYHPIREVVNQVIEGNGHIPPSEQLVDEFQLLKQNATSARHLADKLQQVMVENSSLILQRFYRDLLLGLDTARNVLYQSFKPEQLDYCVSLIEFQESEPSLIEHDLFFCKNIIMTAVGSQPHLQYVNVSSTICAIIIQTSRMEEAKESMIKLSDSLPSNQMIKISISKIRTSMEQIHCCYLESQKILEYKYLYSNTEILTPEQVFKNHTNSYYYPLLMENRLVQQIAEGRELALTSFDHLIRENFLQRDLPPESLRNFIYALLGTLNRTFQELKTGPEHLLQHNIDYELLYRTWSQPNIISIIRAIIEEIILAVKQQNANSDSRMLAEMQNYIYQHYSRDIMLDDMADELGISGKYCSNLFKKLSDDNFKHFLNRYRIEQSKQMIEANPSIKISELGIKVGFNSSNTFIRVFRKYTGMTPKVYANLVLAANLDIISE